MSTVFTHSRTAFRIALFEAGRAGLRVTSILLLGLSLASPVQAQYGDLSPEAGDNFGNALARGDFNDDGYQDLAIGIPSEGITTGIPGGLSQQIAEAGAVEVIYGSATGLSGANRQFWRQGSAGIADLPEAGDRFGLSLAAGDFNGDRFTDLAIGVPAEDINVTDVGAVHVLYGSAQGLSTAAVTPQFWHQESPGVKGQGTSSDFFGWALAAGDFNRDGYADLAIGVPFKRVGTASGAGAVHILFGSPSGLRADFPDDQLWTRANPDLAGGLRADARFGRSLAAGDFNRDGFLDLAIGAPWDRPNFAVYNIGAVNVIYGSASGLSATIIPDQLLVQGTGNSDGPQPWDQFGHAVAAGDFNGDTFDDLAVGVPDEDVGDIGTVSNAGAVNVFYGSASGLVRTGTTQFWDQDSPGVEGGVEPDDEFGWALTVGDFNNDGCDDLAIGLPYEAIGSLATAGAVNVIYGSYSSGLSPFVVLDQLWHQGSPGMPTMPQAGDGFGYALVAGDFNGDGRADLAVGVPGEDVNSASNSGAVNVIYGASAGLNATYVPVQTWSQRFVLPPQP